MIPSLVFYLFALALIFSATMVVTVRRPVHAVLFLVWSFFNAAGLFLTLGAEFLAFILLIVYIGAVAVLFLFIVMMLNVRKESAKKGASRVWPVGVGIAAALLTQLLAVVFSWPAVAPPPPVQAENIRALGDVLYTVYLYPFQVCGLILVVAMIGAIVLTQRKREGVKRQNPWDQLDRDPREVLEVRKIKSGEGAS